MGPNRACEVDAVPGDCQQPKRMRSFYLAHAAGSAIGTRAKGLNGGLKPQMFEFVSLA
jgi:hypothetical protein